MSKYTLRGVEPNEFGATVLNDDEALLILLYRRCSPADKEIIITSGLKNA